MTTTDPRQGALGPVRFATADIDRFHPASIHVVDLGPPFPSIAKAPTRLIHPLRGVKRQRLARLLPFG